MCGDKRKTIVVVEESPTCHRSLCRSPNKGLLKGMGDVSLAFTHRPAASLDIQEESADQRERERESTGQRQTDFKDDVDFSHTTHASAVGAHTQGRTQSNPCIQIHTCIRC